ncbi:MAG: hypothetical protein K1X79_00960 [Oligoflexia bacterium]|nr:hypothetical protein [Oligoflexia bacterium]
MNTRSCVVATLLFALCISPSYASAAEPPPSSVVLANPKKDVLKTSMMMALGSKKMKLSCGRIKKWVPGVNSKTYFYPLSGFILDQKNELAALKAFQASGLGTAATAKQIKKTSANIKTLKGYTKPAAVACKSAVAKAKSSSSGGSGGSSPSNPTDPGGSSYFSGNCLTSYGRSALGIPSSVSSACKPAGQSLANSLACVSCHTEKLGRTFSQVAGSFVLPTMSALPHSNQQVADLVAYLNRNKQ